MKRKIVKEKDFWEEFKELNGKFGINELKLCKKHGFMTSLKDWDFCPYCGEELCE